jgi:hypothetical protein
MDADTPPLTIMAVTFVTDRLGRCCSTTCGLLHSSVLARQVIWGETLDAEAGEGAPEISGFQVCGVVAGRMAVAKLVGTLFIVTGR